MFTACRQALDRFVGQVRLVNALCAALRFLERSMSGYGHDSMSGAPVLRQSTALRFSQAVKFQALCKTSLATSGAKPAAKAGYGKGLSVLSENEESALSKFAVKLIKRHPQMVSERLHALFRVMQYELHDPQLPKCFLFPRGADQLRP